MTIEIITYALGDAQINVLGIYLHSRLVVPHERLEGTYLY
jgi:hypothetical protein